MKLDTTNINPRIINCSYFNGYGFKPVMKMAPRICYDYELDFYLKSDGGVVIEGQYIPFKTGEICFRKPGEVVYGVPPYECYVLSIDMCGDSILPDNDYVFGTPKKPQPIYENPLLFALPTKLKLTKPQTVLKIIKEIYYTSRQKTQIAIFKQNKLCYELLYELLQQYNSVDRLKSVNQQVINAYNFINKHFCEEINIMQLVTESGLSKAYFHKCFKEYTSTSPTSLIIDLRMEKAKTLLCVTDNTIAEVASACGYFDNSYFSALFKRHTGSSPSGYRHQYTSFEV